MNLTDNESRVLDALLSADAYEGFWFFPFAPLTRITGFDRRTVRRACRSLTRKGLAEFGRGLWTEDGEPAGSGYRATEAGREFGLPVGPDGGNGNG